MSCHVQFYQHHSFLSNRECAYRYFHLQMYLLFYLPLYIYFSNFVGRCHRSLMSCSDDFKASCVQSSYPSVILSPFLVSVVRSCEMVALHASPHTSVFISGQPRLGTGTPLGHHREHTGTPPGNRRDTTGTPPGHQFYTQPVSISEIWRLRF